MDDASRLAFENEMLAMAPVFAPAPRELSDPELAEGLREVDRALTVALQVLIGLELEHEERQDIEAKPYNWQLVQALQAGRSHIGVRQYKGPYPDGFMARNYPTDVVGSMLNLREAARVELAGMLLKRGNSERRNLRTMCIERVGKNFVFRYRARFSHMPPVSKSGWVVDLLQKILQIAGLGDVDASTLLRRSINKDPGREWLPSASEYARSASASNAAPTADLKRRQPR